MNERIILFGIRDVYKTFQCQKYANGKVGNESFSLRKK